MSRFHVTNLGKFGTNLITDGAGYAYTTLEEYVNDCGLTHEEAEEAMERIREADEAYDEWENSEGPR